MAIGLKHWIKGYTLPTFTLAYIVIFTVAAGTFLMSISLLSPNPDATRDVLPFATGLVGFLGRRSDRLCLDHHKGQRDKKLGGKKRRHQNRMTRKKVQKLREKKRRHQNRMTRNKNPSRYG